MIESLSYEKAISIFESIRNKVKSCSDEDIDWLYTDFIKSCIAYASTRAEWSILSREQQMEEDSHRTMEHDMVIQNLKILKRALTPWEIPAGLDLLAPDNEDIAAPPARKVIGDFACYITCILGIESR